MCFEICHFVSNDKKKKKKKQTNREIDELIEYNREYKSMKVWEVTWPGNKHTCLLDNHAEEYENVLRDFINGIAPIKVEQLEVGRNAGSEWPPAYVLFIYYMMRSQKKKKQGKNKIIINQQSTH